MLSDKEKEFLSHICKNSNNNVFKSYDAEYIKENLHLISKLESKGFIKKTCDDFCEVLAVVILPEAYDVV